MAGTGSAAHPDIAAARRFVRGLDAAVAVADRPHPGPLRAAVLVPVGRIARLLLRACGEHAALMERGVAAAASERAQAVDYGLRIVAQEQVGLAYAGWDRLLTRVALPAWRMGRWPARLDAGVVSALTELSRRDRLAEGFASRLGERPACDLLEEPGTMDEAASLLAARLFHGGPAECGPDWSPIDWQDYPDEVVDRKWRTEAARLHRVLDEMGGRHPGGVQGPMGPTLSRVLDHLSRRPLREGRDDGALGGTPVMSRVTDPTGSAGAGPVAGASERVGGQHPGGEPRASRSQETPAADPEALLGDPGDDTLPVVPRGLEALDAAFGERMDPDTASPDTESPHMALPDATAPKATTAGTAPVNPAVPGTTSGAVRRTPVDAGTTDGRACGDPAQSPSVDDAADPADSADPADPSDPAEPSGPAGSQDIRTNSAADIRTAGRDTPADALAARISAELAREAAASQGASTGPGGRSARASDPLPLVPLQPPRSGRELLADHVTAMVCCSAVDTAGAHPGLDWLDGPTLLVRGERHADLSGPVHSLVEDGDPGPLRSWLTSLGVRPEKPVRLV